MNTEIKSVQKQLSTKAEHAALGTKVQEASQALEQKFAKDDKGIQDQLGMVSQKASNMPSENYNYVDAALSKGTMPDEPIIKSITIITTSWKNCNRICR